MMSEEFGTAVSWYLLKNGLNSSQVDARSSDKAIENSRILEVLHSQCFKVEIEYDEEISDALNSPENGDTSKGKTFSSAGPAEYVGDILEHPDLLWTEDTWTKEKEQAAMERIKLQGGAVSEYWRNHYEDQAGRYWHQFYQRNKDHFYKDRHYLHIVFPELQSQSQNGSCVNLLEVGCGVGNAVVPLLDINPHLYITAVDFAKSAIQILQQHIGTMNEDRARRIVAKVNNVAADDPPVEASSTDLVLCMFVLSAMSKESHLNVFQKLGSVLKPGGKLLMRDYGRYDEAQLRFKKGSKLDDNFYVRQDGTCSYFFSIEELTSLAEEAGFEIEELHYILRQYANRQQKKARYRVWIHAKFVKK